MKIVKKQSKLEIETQHIEAVLVEYGLVNLAQVSEKQAERKSKKTKV